MKDMIVFYFAGHDTSSHSISSIIFYVRKHPEVYKKCMKDIQNNFGDIDPSDLEKEITPQKLDSLEYLNYVIKETLRYDNPASISLGYKAIDDVTICGIPLPKDSKIFLGIHACHYNSKDWKEPEKYIPERFDPEISYFNSQSNLNSFIPFSFGLRS